LSISRNSGQSFGEALVWCYEVFMSCGMSLWTMLCCLPIGYFSPLDLHQSPFHVIHAIYARFVLITINVNVEWALDLPVWPQSTN